MSLSLVHLLHIVKQRVQSLCGIQPAFVVASHCFCSLASGIALCLFHCPNELLLWKVRLPGLILGLAAMETLTLVGAGFISG